MMNKLLFAAFAALIAVCAVFNGCGNKSSNPAKASNAVASASDASTLHHPTAAYQADRRYGVVETIYANKSDVNAASRNQVLQVTVKLDDGEKKILTQKAGVADLAVGERVKVVGRQVYPA